VFYFALAGVWATPGSTSTKASVAASAVAGIGLLFLGCTSFLQHTRSVRPSLLHQFYLFITIILDMACVRTLWLRQDYSSVSRRIAILYTLAFVIKICTFVIESLPKRQIPESPSSDASPEARADMVNRALFWWINPLFVQGYSSTLEVPDLPVLDKSMSARNSFNILSASWEANKTQGKASLLGTAITTLKWPLLSAVPARLALIGFTFAQPILLKRALAVSSSEPSEYNSNVGYALIGAYFLVYTGMAISLSQHQHRTYRAITMLRGGLVSMIYRKATGLSLTDADPANSVTLMSADVERIVQGWSTITDMWANPLEIGLAIFLLQQELGVAVAVNVGVMVFALMASLVAMGGIGQHQANWLKAIEKRLSSTGSMLSSLKGIKMMGLENVLINSLQGLRMDEMRDSAMFRKLLVVNMAFAWLARVFSPIATIGTFAGLSGGNISTSKIFTSLSIFALGTDPLLTLVMALMQFAASAGSFTRIEEFLNKDTVQSIRAGYEDSAGTQKRQLSPTAASLADISEEGDIEMEPKPLHPENPFLALSGTAAIDIEKASFGWDTKKDPILKDITATIAPGTFTMVIGPSGCGKSTLLQAMLGEVPSMGGSMHAKVDSMAYCSQSPWHMNVSIRESVTAMLEFDAKWYRTVLRACALDKDLEQISAGDDTIIGSGGTALSGGQSQRIALARAIYSRKTVIMMDDPFSGLDASTENQIFHNLLGTSGLLREIGSTVIVASSSVKRVPYADHIISLDGEGHVSETGGFDTLDKKGGYVASFALGMPDWKYEPAIVVLPTVSEIPLSKEAVVKEHDKTRQEGDTATYMYYVKSVGWGPTMIFIVSMAIFVFCLSYPSIWLKQWAREADPAGRMNYYMGIYAMLGGIAMFTLIAGSYQLIVNMVPISGANFHRILLTTTLGAKMSFLSITDTGSILNRFSQDLQLIDMDLPVAAINVVATGFLCIAQLILVGVSFAYAAISFPFLFFFLYLIQRVYLRTSRQLRLLDIEAKAPLFSHFTDTLKGLPSIRAFGWQQPMEEKNFELLELSQRPFYMMNAIQRWLSLTLDLMVAGIAVILMILVATIKGNETGDIGVALYSVVLFTQSIKMLLQFWTNLETHIGSISRIKQYSEETPREGQSNASGQAVPASWPQDGKIEFRKISAGYSQTHLAIKELSLTIQAGDKIGLCGRTGR
jgi:ABC-type multidrug transport system fused ATPase/permease subunit